MQTQRVVSKVLGSVGVGLNLSGLLGSIPSAYLGEEEDKNLAGKEDTFLSGMWGMESPWHKVVAQLLKDLPAVTWEKLLLDCVDSSM